MAQLFIALGLDGSWLDIVVAVDAEAARSAAQEALAAPLRVEARENWEDGGQRISPAGAELVAATCANSERPFFETALRRWLLVLAHSGWPADLPLRPNMPPALWHLFTDWLPPIADTTGQTPGSLLFPLACMVLAGDAEAQDILTRLAAVATLDILPQPGRVVTSEDLSRSLLHELQEGNPVEAAWEQAVTFCARYPSLPTLLNLSSNPTADQLRSLLATANDARADHVLWADPFGSVHLTALHPRRDSVIEWAMRLGGLVKFRQETCCQGNGYVGKAAAADAAYVVKLYQDLVQLWAEDARGYCG